MLNLEADWSTCCKAVDIEADGKCKRKLQIPEYAGKDYAEVFIAVNFQSLCVQWLS